MTIVVPPVNLIQKVIELQASESIEVKKRYYTNVALKDELTLQLSSKADYHVNPEYNHIEIVYKYYEYVKITIFNKY